MGGMNSNINNSNKCEWIKFHHYFQIELKKTAYWVYKWQVAKIKWQRKFENEDLGKIEDKQHLKLNETKGIRWKESIKIQALLKWKISKSRSDQ